MANCANIAATIHAKMCEDPGFGYSQGNRYGDSSDPVTYNIEGRNYTINRGDYDCSSSVCKAWQKALEGTNYEGALNGATYTGNMRSVFANSGLFEVWDTYSTNAVRGDVYLNDTSHTAMCQDGGNDGVYGYDCLSEFSINEFGTITGGRKGDQTGWESAINNYYDFPWNCTLHYNGKADKKTPSKNWPLNMWSSNGGKNQRFIIKENSDKTVSVKCVANNKNLDLNEGNIKNGTPIQLYEPNDSKAQKWKFIQKSNEKDAPYEIVLAANEKYCLDVVEGDTSNGAKLCLWQRHGGKNQEWYKLDNGDGSWTLVNNGLGPKLVLDAVGGGE